MSSINNYSDLEEEKLRLQQKLVHHKQLIRQDLDELREEFQPAVQFFSAVGNITKRTRNNPLLSFGVSLATDVILAKTVFAHSNPITRTVIPFLVKKVTSLFRRSTK